MGLFWLARITNQLHKMPTLIENLQTAQKLENLRAAMKSILADKWEETVQEQRPFIEGLMQAEGHDNAIKAVMPVVKSMKADGECPLLVLAVAAEITLRQNATAHTPDDL